MMNTEHVEQMQHAEHRVHDMSDQAPGFWPAFRRSAADNGVPLALAGIAFGGSFTHWVRLAESHGQRGPLAPAVAICVDLGVYMAAAERQRDVRVGRERRGWASWPTLVMAGGIALTLAGNVASAQRSPWGIVTALIPGLFLLVSISLMERRTAHRARMAAAAAVVAERQAAGERQRQAGLAAERERQETARLEAEAAAKRQADRQAELAARRAAIVNGASVITGAAASRLALPAGAGPAADAAAPGDPGTSATAVMRAFWDREVAAGRTPSGADLLRAANVPSSSSLGRQMAARWRRELEGASA
jgi:hypothetical protein